MTVIEAFRELTQGNSRKEQLAFHIIGAMIAFGHNDIITLYNIPKEKVERDMEGHPAFTDERLMQGMAHDFPLADDEIFLKFQTDVMTYDFDAATEYINQLKEDDRY